MRVKGEEETSAGSQPVNAILFSSLDEKRQEWLKNRFMTWQNMAGDAYMAWGIEIVRSLILLNASGVAGTAALFAAQKFSRPAFMIGAISCFFLGALLALITMLVRYFHSLREMLYIQKWVGQMLTDQVSVADFDGDFSKLSKRLIWTAGISAAVAFAFGGIAAVHGL